jgi:hypothetical protein
MYFLMISLLMLVLPLASIIHEAGLRPDLTVAGKWFVFWMVGARLFAAGLRQILQPRYTAEKILGIQGDANLVIVRELGFANLALGIGGIATLAAPTWTPPLALVGGIFYAAAGIQHALQSGRNKIESFAMATDLFAAFVLLGFFVWTLRFN